MTQHSGTALVAGASSGIGAAYAAHKAVVLTLTQGLAAEVGGKGARLQAVLPGSPAPDSSIGRARISGGSLRR